MTAFIDALIHFALGVTLTIAAIPIAVIVKCDDLYTKWRCGND
jgi:hypothetical protein